MAAEGIVELLKSPARLEALGTRGRGFVNVAYDLDVVLDQWVSLLNSPVDRLKEIHPSWRGPIGARYWAERVAGITHLGRPYRTALDLSKGFLR